MCATNQNPIVNKIGKPFLLTLLATLIMSGFFIFKTIPANSAGPTYIPPGTNIDAPTTWTLENSPYVIDNKMSDELVVVNAELTIEPGVIVKFKPRSVSRRFGGIQINGGAGKLVALGTPEQPIIFTSFYDNQVETTLGTELDPQYGDWKGLFFSNDQSVLENIQIKYGANHRDDSASLKFKNGSQAHLTNVEVSYGWGDAIAVMSNAAPQLENFSISNTLYISLRVEEDAGPGILKNAVFKDNGGEFLMEVHPNSLFDFENISYENNAQPTILFRGDLNRSVVWQNIGLPYFVASNIRINSNIQVDIEPGAVFKMGKYNGIVVNGKLNAEGEEDKPIIFTSGSDNGSSAIYNWGGIFFDNAVGQSILKNVEVRYAGFYRVDTGGYFYDSVRINNSSVLIRDSKIEHGFKNGIYVLNNGQLTLRDSQIYGHWTGLRVEGDIGPQQMVLDNRFFDNKYNAISYNGTPILEATMNWWGDDSGPTHPDNPTGIGENIFGNVNFDPWIGKQRDPVILIPGITGSWERSVSYFDPITGNYVFEKKYVPDPILGTYDNLWQALINQGYEAQVDLYAFGYNWRDYNNNTAILLKEKIQEVKQRTGARKVDLVVHSMGGLVARAYIQSDDYLNDVDQLIFLGTPHLGSLNAYLQYEAVAGFESPDKYFIIPYFQSEALANGYFSLTKYVQEKVPALRELLPINNYLKQKINNEWVPRIYPDENYERNYFLENLNLDSQIEKLKNRVRITNIVSQRQPEDTIVSIRTVGDPNPTDNKWIHGYPENYDDKQSDQGLEIGFGDDTVPVFSADIFSDVDRIYCESMPTHKDMPTECQQYVIEKLTGVWPDEIYRASKINKILFIGVHSPVEFQVIDEQGNVVGQDFASSDYFEDIPNSMFDDEYGFAFIKDPTDQDYTIKLIGIDEGGGYELFSHLIDVENNESYEDSIYGIIGVGKEHEYIIHYNDEQVESNEIDIVNNRILTADIIQDLNDMLGDNSKYKVLKKFLIQHLEKIQTLENKIESENKEWKIKIDEKLILGRTKLIIQKLNLWLKLDRISQDIYNILISDINLLEYYYSES